MHKIHINQRPNYEVGDPAPSMYLDWHTWALVQHKAGLRQSQCPGCGKWKYPQEFAGCCKKRKGRR